jgi:hypothetical protein
VEGLGCGVDGLRKEVTMDKILKKQLAALNYIEPEELGRNIMSTVIGILQKPETVSHLSDKEKNVFLEKHQAGFLAFMYKYFSGSRATVTVCVTELQDFDCVIKGVMEEGDIVYKRVQLKQLANHEKSKNLQAIIDKLKSQYPTSSDLVVAIWINRDINLEFERLDFNGLNIQQLWLFGDSILGELTLDGGSVSELVSGLRWAAVMKDGERTVWPVRFKPMSRLCTH